MSQTQNRSECKTMCWIVAAIAGLVLMIFLYKVADFSGFASFIFGLIAGCLLAYFLPQFMCRDEVTTSNSTSAAATANQSGQATSTAAATAGDPTTTAGGNDAGSSNAAVASAAATTSAATASTTPSSVMASPVKPSTPLAGQAELASRKGDWKYEAPAKKPAVKKAAAKAPAKAAAKAPAKKAAKAPAKAAAKAPAKAKRAPVAADGKPLTLSAAPAGGADDLKLISGVGPKLEQVLNELGFYQFQQIAAWRKKEAAWVDERLPFKGRIERDDWMSQAKILAKGGETEFSKRSKKT